MSTCPIVDKMWHPDVKREAGAQFGIVCENHKRKVIVAYMLELQSVVASVYLDTLKGYLQGGDIPLLEKPTHFTESAIAMRITKLACTVATYTGYGSYARALQYAMMGKAALGLLLNKDVTEMLLSLMPLLEEFNLKTPNDMMCVYYLGCKTELQRKRQVSADPIGETGILALECPDDVLATLGQNVAYAQWLYAATLPRPHDSKEWGAWYLSRILQREGWRLAASHIDSAELPDGSLCPAFVLVVRDSEREQGIDATVADPERSTNKQKGSGKKEAILVIRGSRNLTDWRINVTRNVTTFAYRCGPTGAGLAIGGVHTGMLVAARAILGTKYSNNSICVEQFMSNFIISI